MRRSSGIDVPGAVIQCMRKSRSLKPGKQLLAEPRRDDEPIEQDGGDGADTRCRGRRITSDSSPAVAALEPAHERRLAALGAAFATAGSGSAPGVTVSATTIETSTASA